MPRSGQGRLAAFCALRSGDGSGNLSALGSVPDVADQEAKTMAPDGPVFDQFNLVVSDMAATVEFFRLLGLEIPDTAPELSLIHI